MHFQQFYLGCLSHASYLIGSGGVAAVVDPQRDVGIYIEDAARNGLKIEYVLETHLHADFISGHQELAGSCLSGCFSRPQAVVYRGAASVVSENPARIPVEVRDRGGLPTVLSSMPLAGWLRVSALWKPTRVRVGEP
jgi:glyoxylase-like metal-dependent hydrolase (beta-lactamase superfamily II)